MPSARQMRLRIRSVGNIAQLTRALQAVSASRVRKAEQAVRATRPYADKAWQVLQRLAEEPTRNVLHPLLTERAEVRNSLVVVITSDRGLAGAYNTNVLRFALQEFRDAPHPVAYVIVGRKGRDVMARRRVQIRAEFSGLPAEPSFADVSAIGRIAIDDYLSRAADQVHLVYTDYVNLLTQIPRRKKLLPLEVPAAPDQAEHKSAGIPAAYIYEPSAAELVDAIVPRLTSLQIFQAVLESMASEHSARMVAMRNATENARELGAALRLTYNKARQQGITSDILDIVGGVEALAEANAQAA
ncbi:MAG: ATP synthase F1 subunit gamma [Anaerolineales bacterium]